MVFVMVKQKVNIEICRATVEHLDLLLDLEEKCFTGDKLSRRSMRRFLLSEQSVFRVAMVDDKCVGYLLIIFYRGTRLARLYSIAVNPDWRGQGIARQLMLSGEHEAQQQGALYFRLEVNNTNESAIKLYESLGFIKFGFIQDYYEDHSDALRLQKRIRFHDKSSVHTAIPWYQQSTTFTCGPAALMMAMAGLKPSYKLSQSEEMQIWREATTIFMTSGHGGCHPLGLALAAKKRGFRAEVWINQRQPLFVEGVRQENKKAIIELVHKDFVKQSKAEGIVVHYQNIDQKTIIDASNQGAVPIVLISTFRMDRKKAPHWVAVSGYDDYCLYVHDPDPIVKNQQDPMDCQYLPIARQDFEPMTSFGGNRLRTAIILFAE